MTATKNCYCDDAVYRVCAFCQEQLDREENRKVCDSWNWNCTPEECARDAKNRDWSSHRVQQAMQAYGFSPQHVSDVLYAFEVLET